MPYFIDDKNCVRKGTKAEPGEVEKCHESREAAVAHIRALYASVEDAEEKAAWDAEIAKGGPGSGWHRPPEGTHTAENAPNFAGGPGADRTYGTEREEAPRGSKLCKCVKCGSTFTLPKGKRCEDTECPGCGGKGRQVLARFDPKAEGEEGEEGRSGREGGSKKSVDDCPACEEEEKAMDAPGPQMHGSGGALGEVASVLGDGDGACKCPGCGKELPCTAKACPHCKATFDKVERMESDKAEWSAASVNDLPDSAFLYIEKGEKDGEGKTTPRSKRHLPYKSASGEVDLPHLRNAISRLGQPATGEGWLSEDLRASLLSRARRILSEHGGGEEKSFISYKSADGRWRWLSLSNWAVVDREGEVITEKAYRDAIAHAEKSGDWGRLDLVHVDGTEVGDPDMLFLVKQGHVPPKIGAGGTWDDTERATKARRAIQADPEHWGISLKFRFDPERRVHGVYTGGIQILRHSILPRKMAASYGTAIAVQQGGGMSKQVDEKTAEALSALGVSEDEIAALSEKAKAAPKEEENVVEKEGATEQEPNWLNKLAEKVGQVLGRAQEPEQAMDASPPEEARKADEVTPANEAEPAEGEKAAEGEPAPMVPDEAFKAMGEALAGAMKAELDKRDELITELQEQIKALSGSIEDKVEARLSDMPPVTKVAASMVGATAVDDPEAQKEQTYVGALMDSVVKRTDRLYGNKVDKLEV